MFSALIKILLILTAMVPICLIYAYVAFTEGYLWVPTSLVIAAVVLTGVCYRALTNWTKRLETFPFEFSSVEPADQENLSLLLLYLSPLFVGKIADVNYNLLVPALSVYAFVMATSYTYHFNPMISLMGWHFFKVESKEGVSYVLLTTKKIRNVDRIAKVGQLTGYMLIDLSE